jgi:hypothetical protein
MQTQRESSMNDIAADGGYEDLEDEYFAEDEDDDERMWLEDYDDLGDDALRS